MTAAHFLPPPAQGSAAGWRWFMGRRKQKLSISSGAGGPTVKLRDEDWSRIELALHYPVLEGVRQEIIDATNEYLASAALEHSAPPVSTAQDRAREIKTAAGELHKALARRIPDDQNAADVLVRHRINKLLDKSPSPSPIKDRDKLRVLAGVALSVVRACTVTLNYLARPNNPGYRVGDAWNWWMWEFSEIFKRDRLPVGTRNDSDSGRPSPFVVFV
jgi:hypothetical protein